MSVWTCKDGHRRSTANVSTLINNLCALNLIIYFPLRTKIKLSCVHPLRVRIDEGTETTLLRGTNHHQPSSSLFSSYSFVLPVRSIGFYSASPPHRRPQVAQTWWPLTLNQESTNGLPAIIHLHQQDGWCHVTSPSYLKRVHCWFIWTLHRRRTTETHTDAADDWSKTNHLHPKPGIIFSAAELNHLSRLSCHSKRPTLKTHVALNTASALKLTHQQRWACPLIFWWGECVSFSSFPPPPLTGWRSMNQPCFDT